MRRGSRRTTSSSTGRSGARSLDLGMLRNHGPAEGEAYLAAGIPWFTTLFGRDSIIAALELVAFIPDASRSRR